MGKALVVAVAERVLRSKPRLKNVNRRKETKMAFPKAVESPKNEKMEMMGKAKMPMKKPKMKKPPMSYGFAKAK